MAYLPRLIDTVLAEAVEISGMVLLQGMRGCGKTESAKRVAKSLVQLDRDPSALHLATISPSAVLAGATPRLVDEWQLAPALWNEARHSVDESQNKGLYIFTGSASKVDATAMHPGSSRVIKLQMRTLSVFESGFSSRHYSLTSLFEGTPVEPYLGSESSLDSILEQICTGGWPAYVGLTSKQASRYHRSYLDDVVNYDLKALEGPSDPQVAKRVLTAIARTVGEKTPVTKIVSQVTQSGTQLRHQTAQAYISQFESLWITEEVPAWVPHLRSRYKVNQASKRYFGDASLAASALAATPERLKSDLNTAGFLFENYVVSSLLTYVDFIGGQASHYRDESGREVDLIIHDDQGRWGAIEVKLGYMATDKAAESLLAFAASIDQSASGKPAFLAVVTNSSSSYQRPDGVHVISISQIAP